MKKACLVAFATVSVLLLVGTFADLQISYALYNPESAFGGFFAVAGMVPLWTLVPMSAGLMLGALIAQFGKLGWIRRVFCLGVLAFGVYTTYKRTAGSSRSRHLHGLPFPALVCIVVATFILAAALGAYASRKYPKEVFAAAIVGIAAICGGRALVNDTKNLWGRQRFWTMDDPAAQFTAWYRPQFPSAERLSKMGDRIKSFPSGHSLGGISVLWFSMFPGFIGFCRKNKRAWSNGLTACALCFWALVAASRIVLGEHFLSDVSASAMLFLTLFAASSWVAARL